MSGTFSLGWSNHNKKVYGRH